MSTRRRTTDVRRHLRLVVQAGPGADGSPSDPLPLMPTILNRVGVSPLECSGDTRPEAALASVPEEERYAGGDEPQSAQRNPPALSLSGTAAHNDVARAIDWRGSDAGSGCSVHGNPVSHGLHRAAGGVTSENAQLPDNGCGSLLRR
jgi:hypothetical protein